MYICVYVYMYECMNVCMYVYVSKQSYMLENNYTHVWQANAIKAPGIQRAPLRRIVTTTDYQT